jgi:SagB-type dehydrogenase family enzyme
MKKILFLPAFLLAMAAVSGQEPVVLPAPKTDGGMPLMDALRIRESERSFAVDELSLQELSNLLWAANGVNRTNGKRTAPSSMNYQEIDVYVLLKAGIYRYDARGNTLHPIVGGDFRAVAGKQDFVSTAPVNLVYVADFSRVPKGETEAQLNASYANSGFIAQNVYLFCASEKLACVVRAYFDPKVLGETLKLSSTQRVILTQTVGKKK